jgi:bifunctional UDP-N-acetylglucosamine pyrophosphorylase/glucosamine-1-phosphate N-acetyltransferase
MNLDCVVLAAGLGTRMKSAIPKVLHTVCGIPMLKAVIAVAKTLHPERILVVVGKQGELIKNTIGSHEVSYALQEEPRGTGHALRCARPALKNSKGVIVVLNGDTPLLNPDTIKKFLHHHKKNKNTISVLSFNARNPEHYGRIIRNASGQVVSIVEHRDADSRQKEINEVNSGVFAINHDVLDILDKITVNRAKGEYYLTDIIAAASKKNLRTSAYCIGTEEEFMGINTREELSRASALMKRNIIQSWIARGVNFLDAGSVYIHPDVSIGKETTIYPNVCLEGHTRIGKGSIIYPNVRVRNSDIGNGAIIKDSTVIEDSRVKNRAAVGPFACLRPGSEIGTEVRIGNFVEIKKSVIGKRTKASHLSYIGDAIVGKDVNIGAGTITCNYDGRAKHSTKIEDGVFIGSDTQLVAPVCIGKGAYVGAGSTITRDVPPMSLATSRVHQTNSEGWAQKRQLEVKSEKLKVKKGKKT